MKSESTGKPERAESQRDSATKPRVARNELPWENVMESLTTLKGLRLGATTILRGHNPVGVERHVAPHPG